MPATAIDSIDQMPIAEAQNKTNQIKRNMRDNRRLALEIYQRQGWAAMGYASFKAWAEGEFGKSYQHVYRLKDAALTEAALRAASPLGELPERIPERHLRELKILPTPEQQLEAYQNARSMAVAEGDTQVKTCHIQASVEVVQAKEVVLNTPYHVVGHMVTKGEMSIQVARQMTEALDMLKPRSVCGQVIELIAKHGLTCSDLISELGQMLNRPADKPSKTLATILATGHVAGVPLAKATMTDLKQARWEASKEHQAEAEEAARQRRAASGTPEIRTIIANVYVGDWAKTVKQLARMLTEDDLRNLLQALAGQLRLVETIAEVNGVGRLMSCLLDLWGFDRNGLPEVPAGDPVRLWMVRESDWAKKSEVTH